MTSSQLTRQLRRRVRRGIHALPAPGREIALAMASGAGEGPRVLPGPPEGPVLVLAPHPDDEAIGPGGALARHADDGDAVTVLLLTSGGATAAGGADVTSVREAETRRALRHLAPTVEPVLLRLTDGALSADHEQLVEAVSRHGAGARCVYVPSLLDPHPDHREAAVALADSDLGDDVLVLGYEVWAAAHVDVLLDVTGVFARKQAALAEYRTALDTVDYVRSASGLAAYRSASGGMGGTGFVEGFTAMDLGAHRQLVHRLV